MHQFGFHVPTCCGRIPQANEWCDDWVQFLARDKLEPQVGGASWRWWAGRGMHCGERSQIKIKRIILVSSSSLKICYQITTG